MPLSTEEAYELWTDVRRWPTFIDGFSHSDRLDEAWPGEGAKHVWKSVPGGRGQVTERVTRARPASAHEMVVFEDKLDGTQRVEFAPDGDGTRVDLTLEYKVSVGGPLGPLVDVLFIRRAQNDSLARTLRRFRTEAEEQAAL